MSLQHSLPVALHGRLHLLLQGSIMIHPFPFRFIAVVTKEATFTQLDCLMRSIWFECCGHNSFFKAGSYPSQLVGRPHAANSSLTKHATHELALQLWPTKSQGQGLFDSTSKNRGLLVCNVTLTVYL